MAIARLEVIIEAGPPCFNFMNCSPAELVEGSSHNVNSQVMVDTNGNLLYTLEKLLEFWISVLVNTLS